MQHFCVEACKWLIVRVDKIGQIQRAVKFSLVSSCASHACVYHSDYCSVFLHHLLTCLDCFASHLHGRSVISTMRLFFVTHNKIEI